MLTISKARAWQIRHPLDQLFQFQRLGPRTVYNAPLLGPYRILLHVLLHELRQDGGFLIKFLKAPQPVERAGTQDDMTAPVLKPTD